MPSGVSETTPQPAVSTRTVKLEMSPGSLGVTCHLGITCSNSVDPPGVKVEDAHPADLIYKSGLREGDIIVSIDDVGVSDHEIALKAIETVCGRKGSATLEYYTAAAVKDITATKPPVSPEKSVFVAYVLFLAGGFFSGLHHFYLGRDVHAVLHAISFGGLGFGNVRDFFCMPRYVSDANEDAAHQQALRVAKAARPTRPSCGLSRTIAMLWFGTYFAAIFSWLAPSQVDAPWSRGVSVVLETALMMLGSSLAVGLVGNLPPHTLSYRRALVGSCLGLLLPRPLVFAIGAMVGWRRSVGWAPKVRPRRVRLSVARRAAVVVVGSTLAWGAVLGAAYQRLEVAARLSNGGVQRVRFKDGVHHLLNSPFFRSFASNTWTLLSDAYTLGWRAALHNSMSSFDLAGETAACEVLGLEVQCLEDFSSVKRAHRALVLEHHPDKLAGASDEERDRSAAKFREVQEAYEHLSKLNSQRKKAGE
jgi:DnaJ family protein C protein 22